MSRPLPFQLHSDVLRGRTPLCIAALLCHGHCIKVLEAHYQVAIASAVRGQQGHLINIRACVVCSMLVVKDTSETDAYI